MAYDDQDDLNKWLQSQDSPNLTPQSSFQAPQQDAQGPGVWSKARDLMDRQSQMQYQPQDYSKYLGQKEAAPDRTGNDFRTILAMALDLFGNKGRGAGQLMQAGNQTFDAKEAAWKRENGPQAQLARQMQVKQLEGADRAAFNNDRATMGAQIGQEMQMAGAQSQQQNQDRTFAAGRDDHDDAQAQQQLQRQVQEEQFGASQGQAKTFHDDSMKLSQDQMAQQARLSGAQMGQADRHFNLSQQQHERDQANEMARAQAAMQAQQLRQQQQDAQHNTERGQDLSHQLSEETEDSRALLQPLNAANLVLDKYKNTPDRLPGIGPAVSHIDPNGRFGKLATQYVPGLRMTEDERKDAVEMQSAIENLRTFNINKLSGSAHSKAEEAQQILLTGGDNPANVRHALGVFNDAINMDFKARGSGGRDQAMKGILEPYGRANIFDPPAPAPAPNDDDDPFANLPGGYKIKGAR